MLVVTVDVATRNTPLPISLRRRNHFTIDNVRKIHFNRVCERLSCCM